ncbi:MAG TPA: NAD(P)/FAD-dependent oxidoreductase [Caulobacterales bacterium]|nr:NAD(P)/FAD-dependent oxidoreductase [Caulobacterales bacterium]
MRIGIVGCGIGGMAAAIALAREGHGVTLFERFNEPAPVGAGLLLQPSGLEALGALGLRDEVEARGARVAALRGRTPSGRPVIDLSYARWKPNCYGLGAHRATLFSALHRAVRDAGVEIRCGAEIVRIETPARPVLIDTGENRLGPFDLAIIANGAASGLRDGLLPKARAPLYPWGAIWTIRPDQTAQWDGVLAQVYAGARVMIGVLPVGDAPDSTGKNVALFWSLREDDHAAWRKAGVNAWRAAVASYWPEAARLLDGPLDISTLSYARYRDVQAWPWGKDATLLLGDAAHATSPQLGQGANLALADAVALAATLRGRAVAPALACYRRSRAGPIAWVQFMSAALTPVFQSRSAFIGWARDWILGPLSRCWPFSQIMLATLTGAATLPFAMLLSGVAKFLVPNRRN